MTALERFGEWIAGAAIPTEGVALHLVDAVAAWIAGAGTAEGALIRRVEDPVARHCAWARLSEIDDIHLASAVTPGGVIVPAALTLAAECEADGAALARAIAAGYEASVRLGRAIDGPHVLYRGVWPTCFAAPFGVAAASASLLGLDAARTAHALGIALGLASPGAGRSARWLALGHAAAGGVRAARWAQSGFTADLGLMEGALFSVYGIRADVSALTSGLGDASALAQTGFKPWCAARQTMAAAQAWLELTADGFADDGTAEIRVGVPAPYAKMVDHGVVPGERASYLTSVPYQLALAAVEREARFDVQQSPAKISPAVNAFMARVKVEPDAELLAQYPESWPARVDVAGRRRVVMRVPGEPQRPWTERDVLAKFERYADVDIARMALGVVEGRVAPAALLARIQ
ncbi:MAG TPA: MmgE/PrpD family protein [Burkholderiales bacterium]